MSTLGRAIEIAVEAHRGQTRRDGSPYVLHPLRLLTHEEGVPYDAYVEAIAPHPLARTVKLADLEDNMNLRELPEVTQWDLERTEKYHRAWIVMKKLAEVAEKIAAQFPDWP